ncbi:MAG: fatty acid--CoA ligase family protein [Verrucomicrobiota bacterium]|jgi:acyl-CoA synthetase (AMP-forming)/AMP-acid ligase II
MLYHRWLRVARQQGRMTALRDLATSQEWTFEQLRAAAETSSPPASGVHCPSGARAEFILQVLRAWRRGVIVAPLEDGQDPPPLADDPAPLALLKSAFPLCAHLKTTSATTGRPRLIAFSESQLAADAEQIVATMGLRPEWPNLGVISMAHSYGFSNLVLPLLLHGIPLILGQSALPESVSRAGVGAEALTLPAVPALWRAWHEARAIPATVRLAISAGAPLPVALEQQVFAASGLKIHNFYGSSECGGIAFDATESPRAEGAGAGVPMRGVELNCDDEGCLEVRSRAAGLGYWPEASPDLGDGFFRTNDLAELKGGWVHLRGRRSDLINVAGRKVAPETIESALLAHEAVRECVVLGLPDPGGAREETIAVCVVPRRAVGTEDLRQFLLRQLPAWQVPRHWRTLDALPVNGRGKVPRVQLRRIFNVDTGPRQKNMPG